MDQDPVMDQDDSHSEADRTIRIFISSPGDVGQERVIAERVIERLRGEFGGRADIEPVLWEHEPLRATEHFQEQITPPAETDIAVFILWSRLGTPLPEDQFQKESGEQYQSGTEWEFENAVEAYRETGTPDLLTYRKTKDPETTLSDEEALQRRIEQKQALESFVDRWFKGKEGTLKAAFHTFEMPDEFERRLEEHLRQLIEEKLPERQTEGTVREARWHEGSPFRGLQAFEYDHAPVFFGRTKAVGEIASALEQKESEGRPFVLALGPSGSGKSSVVKAGVAPTITQPGVIEGVGLWRRALFRPSDAPEDLVSGLAKALLAEGAVPQVESYGFDADELAGLLREAPARAANPIERALQERAEAVAEEEGVPEAPEARLLLIVDQMEELFTLEEVGAEEREAFAQALKAIVEDGPVWTIGTMRSDFYPRAAEVETLHTLMQGAGQYALPTPSFAEIGQMIRYPAQAAGLRFEKDLDQGVGLDEVLHEAAANNPEALPLLEFTLEELYQRRDGDVLTFEAYEELGGLEGALAERAEETCQDLPADARDALPAVMESLVTIRDEEDGSAEGAAASRRVPLKEVTGTEAKEALIDAFVEARLLVTNRNDAGEAVVSVAHEALLREWPRLRGWIERNQSFLRTRARVAERAARWDEEGRPDDLLLPTGQPLAEGRSLLEERAEALGDAIRTYVDRSIERAERKERRRRYVVGAVAAAFFLVAAGFGVFSYQQWASAAEQRDETLRSQSQYLADQARQEADEGDPMTGMLLALKALPRDLNDPDRPFVEEAASALRYSLIRNRELALFDGHGASVTQAAVDQEGRYAASASTDSTVRLYNLRNHEVADILPHEGPVHHVEFRSGSGLLSSSEADLHLWSVPGGSLEKRIEVPGQIREVTAGLNEKQAMVVTEKGEALAVNLEDGSARTILGSDGLQIRGAHFGPRSDQIIFSSRGRLGLFDMRTGERQILEKAGRVRHLQLSGDRNRLAAVVDKNKYRSEVQVWDTEKKDKVWALSIPPLRFRKPPFSLGPGGESIAVILPQLKKGELGRPLEERDISSPEVYSISSGDTDPITINPPAEVVQDLSFSADGSKVLTISGDGAVAAWNVSSGNQVAGIPAGIPGVMEGASHQVYSAENGALALTHSKQSVHLWKVTPGSKDVAGGEKVQAFQLSAGDSLLAVLRDENASLESQVLRVPSGEIEHTFSRVGAKLGPNGRFIALGGPATENELILRDLREQEEVTRLQVQDEHPTITFSPGGRYVAVEGLQSNPITVYDLTEEKKVKDVPASHYGLEFWKGQSTIFASRNPEGEPYRTVFWSLPDGEHRGTVSQRVVKVGPNRSTFITDSDSGKANLWTSPRESIALTDREAPKEENSNFRYLGYIYSENGKYIISDQLTGEGQSIKITSSEGSIACDGIKLLNSNFYDRVYAKYSDNYVTLSNSLGLGVKKLEVIDTEKCKNVDIKYRKAKKWISGEEVGDPNIVSGGREVDVVAEEVRIINLISDTEGDHIVGELGNENGTLIWDTKTGAFRRGLPYDFVTNLPSDSGTDYLVLQRASEKESTPENVEIWRLSSLSKEITLPGHEGGVYSSQSEGAEAVDIDMTAQGNLLSRSSAGRLKLWPVFLARPQALINYASERVTRRLTPEQRKDFHLGD